MEYDNPEHRRFHYITPGADAERNFSATAKTGARAFIQTGIEARKFRIASFISPGFSTGDMWPAA